MAERKHWGHFGSPWGFASPGAASSILCTAKAQEHTGQRTQAGMSLGLQEEVGDIQLPKDAGRRGAGLSPRPRHILGTCFPDGEL